MVRWSRQRNSDARTCGSLTLRSDRRTPSQDIRGWVPFLHLRTNTHSNRTIGNGFLYKSTHSIGISTGLCKSKTDAISLWSLPQILSFICDLFEFVSLVPSLLQVWFIVHNGVCCHMRWLAESASSQGLQNRIQLH